MDWEVGFSSVSRSFCRDQGATRRSLPKALCEKAVGLLRRKPSKSFINLSFFLFVDLCSFTACLKFWSCSESRFGDRCPLNVFFFLRPRSSVVATFLIYALPFRFLSPRVGFFCCYFPELMSSGPDSTFEILILGDLLCFCDFSASDEDLNEEADSISSIINCMFSLGFTALLLTRDTKWSARVLKSSP